MAEQGLEVDGNMVGAGKGQVQVPSYAQQNQHSDMQRQLDALKNI